MDSLTSKTIAERIAERAWTILNFDNDPHDGQPHNAHAWRGLLKAINDELKSRAPVEPTDGFTDALAQALYGHDPGAVKCAMKHADDIVGDSMDALALRRLAEEVRRLRAAVPPSEVSRLQSLLLEQTKLNTRMWQEGYDAAQALSR